MVMLMKASMIVYNCGSFSLTVIPRSVLMANRLPGSSMMQAAAPQIGIAHVGGQQGPSIPCA